MTTNVSVFQFEDFRDYLLLRRPPRLGAWAKRLGYRSSARSPNGSTSSCAATRFFREDLD